MTGHAPRRFLIVRLGSLGDVVHGIPAAAALRRRYPDARIDWLVDPRYVEILRLVPAVDHAIPLDPRDNAATLVRSVASLRRTAYHAAVDLQGLLKSAVLARAAGAARTLGFPRAELREPAARAFYTVTADVGASGHVIDKNLALLTALDVSDRRVTFPLNIPESKPADAAVRRFGSTGYVLLNPGAAWPNKRWPAAHFGAVASAMRARYGAPSLVLWGPGDEALAAGVVHASRGAAQLCEPTTIADLCAISAHARVVISGDTGPLHIAAAVGAPIVGLFAPTSAERNGPWRSQDVVVSRFSSCACHYARQCRLTQPCIDSIGVDDVLDAVEQRIGTHG